MDYWSSWWAQPLGCGFRLRNLTRRQVYPERSLRQRRIRLRLKNSKLLCALCGSVANIPGENARWNNGSTMNMPAFKAKLIVSQLGIE